MIQRHPRLDARLEQTIDQPLVPGQSGLVDRARSLWEDTWPCNRKPIRLEAEATHQRDVFGPTVVVVVSYVAGIAIADFSRSMAEAVPDRLTTSVDVNSTFDLVGGGRRAPQEPTWEPLGHVLRIIMFVCHGVVLGI